MNSVEYYKEIMRLQRIKLKNEEAISSEDLAGKYRNSYEKLCQDIKQAQMEYRAQCTKVVRCFTEILSEMAYMKPTDEDYDSMRDNMVAKSHECGGDSLFSGLVQTMMEQFGEMR